MGLHSSLRRHYVDDPAGRQYEGVVSMHGSIHDPEATLPDEMLARLTRHGTIGVLCKGHHLVLQRYGAGVVDNRTSMFYNVPREDGEGGIFSELGIEPPSSREGGIMRDPVRLGRVKDWIKADMGDSFCPIWKQAIDGLDRVTVRGSVTHGPTTLRPPGDVAMPLVCIGDSLRNCGVGGGGILAMQDAVELAKVLVPDGTKEEAPTTVFDRETGRADLAPLRAAAQTMLARKQKFVENKEKMKWMLQRKQQPAGTGDGKAGSMEDLDFTWADIATVYGPVATMFMRLLLPPIQAFVKRSFAADLGRGEAGSTPENALTYKVVAEYMAKEAAAAAAR